MTTIRDQIARHPIAAFLAIALGVTWTLTVAGRISLAFSLLALFGPALAAIIVTRAEGTWPRLRGRITGWRRHIGWYALAVAIPFGVAATARVILELTGDAPDGLGSISAIELVIFVLVIGEEIGWRGFLQPRLRTRFGLATAGLATGLAWVLWHLPIYLTPDQGFVAFLQFAWWVLPLSVVMGAVAEDARWSVIVATVMHGSANISTPILLPDVDRSWWLIVTGVLYAIVAVILVVVARRRGGAYPRPEPDAPTDERADVVAALPAITAIGLAMLMVAVVAACGGGSSTPVASSAAVLPPTTGPTVDVEMQDYVFSAPSVEIEAGTTVRWTNRGQAPHTATVEDGSFDSGQVDAGGSVSHTFATVGTYPYVCTFHHDMKGTVTVVPAAAVGSTAPSAAPGVPSGSPPPPVGRFDLPLAVTTDHVVTIEIIDRTGRVVGATSGTPGDGASVAPDEVSVVQVGPTTLDVVWSGGPCDQDVAMALDPDTATITIVQDPCEGDAIAFDRIVRLEFRDTVDAASFQGNLQPGGDTPG